MKNQWFTVRWIADRRNDFQQAVDLLSSTDADSVLLSYGFAQFLVMEEL